MITTLCDRLWMIRQLRRSFPLVNSLFAGIRLLHREIFLSILYFQKHSLVRVYFHCPVRLIVSNSETFPRNSERPQWSFIWQYLQFRVARSIDNRGFPFDDVITFLIALLLIDYLPVRWFRANRVAFVAYYAVSQATNDRLQFHVFYSTPNYSQTIVALSYV